MTNNIGSSQKGLINGTISATSFMVGHYKQVGKSIMGLVATYGIYKTAVLVAAVNGTLAKSNLSVVTSFNKVKKGRYSPQFFHIDKSLCSPWGSGSYSGRGTMGVERFNHSTGESAEIT